mmetsp:Transcript_37296/g.107467  ORF Transcript_37296/g.107467 Transcript_37296/m.107467 type:complete len:325 (+) Transcript_37296:69-1043(+)
MQSVMALEVHNTFVHFSGSEALSGSEDGSPIRATKSEPVTRPQVRLDVRRRTALGNLGAWPGSDDPAGDEQGPPCCPKPMFDRAPSSESTRSFASTSCPFGSDDDSEPDLAGGWSKASLDSLLHAAPDSLPTAPLAAAAAAAAYFPPPDVVPRQTPSVMPMVVLVPVPTVQVMILAQQPSTDNLATCAKWTIASEMTRGRENKVASEQFLVPVAGAGLQPFQIILYAVGNQGKRGALGFERSCGHGRVEVRCLAQLPHGTGRFSMSVAVGAGMSAQPPRPPVLHDFSQQACCTWRKWDLCSAADASTQTLTIQTTFAPPSGPRT